MTPPAPTPTRTAVPQIESIRVWLPGLVSAAVACAGVGIVFWQDLASALTVWVGSTAYNHCFLIIPLVIALLWSCRGIIKNLAPIPSFWFLGFIPLLSGLWIVTTLLGVKEASQILVISVLEIFLISIIGWRTFRALLAPLLFLFFLVPFGAFVVPILQRFTATFAVHGLQLLDIPVFANGFVIEIPEGTFEVAEACAGLRFLIASIVFGCFFATIMYRSRVRQMVFIGLSIVIPVVANGLRALGIILLGHLKGSASAAATDHVLYGWIFFSLVTLTLAAVGMTFAEPHRFISVDTMPMASSSKFRFIATVAAGLALMLVGPAYLRMIDPVSAEPAVSSLALPPGGGWAQASNLKIDWSPITQGTEQRSLITYRSNDSEVTEFIALYSLPTRGSPFTSTLNSVADPETWHLGDTTATTVPRSSAAPLVVSATIIERQSSSRLVWWFYAIDDQMTTSVLEAKLLQARAALLGGHHVGAFVAISTEADDIGAANSVLTHFVEAMAPWRDLHRAYIGW